MVGFFALDLLPNGNFNLFPFLLSGAAYGAYGGMLRESAQLHMQHKIKQEVKRRVRIQIDDVTESNA
ncbi:MAG: hypothetical protein R3A47_09755 [Polyangiales bacterium]